MLEAEIAKNTDFALTLARCLPRPKASATVEPMGGGYSKVKLHLLNTGCVPRPPTQRTHRAAFPIPRECIGSRIGCRWLPTNGTNRALATSAVRKGIKVNIAGLDGEADQGGISLNTGMLEQIVPHLGGRATSAIENPMAPSTSQGPNSFEAKVGQASNGPLQASPGHPLHPWKPLSVLRLCGPDLKKYKGILLTAVI